MGTEMSGPGLDCSRFAVVVGGDCMVGSVSDVWGTYGSSWSGVQVAA